MRKPFQILPGGKFRPQSKYDEAEFLIGGRGTGPGDVLRCDFRMHEGYCMEASRWVQSGRFPFSTNSDLFRYAVVKVLRETLPELEGQVEGSILHELKHIDEIVVRQQFHIAFEKNLAAIAPVVQALLQKRGGKLEAARMIRGIRRHLDKMRSGFWRDYYEEMFMGQFGHLLPRGPGGNVALSAGSVGEGAEEDRWGESLPGEIAASFAREWPEEEEYDDPRDAERDRWGDDDSE